MRSKVDHYYGYNPSWYSSMESEHFVLIFGITCASLAIGAYVLFGPNFTSKKKTPVLGLQNLGQTCFMNTILQALGSCPIFIIWLDSQSETLGEVGQALRKILQIPRCAVCGHENPLKYDNFDSLSLHLPQRSTLGQTHSLTGLLEDFVDTEIINEFECEMCNKDRLRNSTVSNDLNSVEDSSSENGGNPTPGSLGNQTSQGIPTRPAKVLCDAVRTLRLGKLPPCLCLHIHRTFYSSHGAYKRQDYVDFPEYLVMDPYTLGWIDKDKSLLGDKLNESPSLNTSLVSLNGSVATLGSSGDPGNTIKPRRKPLSLNNTNVQSNCASSFRGRLVSQIRCAVCGHENPLKYDNFDSLSLHLPQRSTLGQTHSLTGLLEDFVDTEIINEFECEMCNKDRLRNSTVSNDLNSVEDSSSENGGNPTPGSLGNQTSQGIPTRPAKVLCDAVRTLRLGKLPPCLCLHIHRTFYSSHGAYKRQDYVDFPEYLVMDPYTYNAVLREKEVGG
ncbi:ubiquitin carboxyl-terminal hydrolase 30 homolog [Diaphorina citri]|uniref:ubiquitinyl hydrolase 1 n=1 Tax=Diaphorina citri TaxID=121845 RepID=A0A3Q0JKF4_DIACI|nr:ubiquitin carboxyl-terminal hydrolase 30 homolog [Diaphorina citri]